MQVEGLYQLGLQCLQFCLAHLLNSLLIRSIRRLHHWISIGILFYLCFDKAMSLNSLFYGMSQLLLVDRRVECQQNGIVIGSLSLARHTLRIDSHLSLRERNREIEN